MGIGKWIYLQEICRLEMITGFLRSERETRVERGKLLGRSKFLGVDIFGLFDIIIFFLFDGCKICFS